MAQKPRNADYTKEYNRKAVLRILRHKAMSRAELARVTGLTRAATSLIVEELLNLGIVTELAPQCHTPCSACKLLLCPRGGSGEKRMQRGAV